MKTWPIILTHVGAIPARDTGEISEVHLYYRFDPSTEGVRDILPNQYQVTFTIEELPERKRAALLTLAQALTDLVEAPSRSLLGQEVLASIQIHHFVYQLEPNGADFYIRFGGRFIWPGGNETSFEHKYGRSDFTPAQQMVFDQILPWAREMALKDAEAVIQEVMGATSTAPRIHHTKKLVMISYRSTEGKDFAHALWRELGATELFIPRIDSYDLDAGNWESQLEDWIDTADSVIAVCTPDYENGPISSKELARAKARLGTTGFSLVPALVTSAPKDNELKRQNGADFRQMDDIDQLESFGEFERLCAILSDSSRNLFDHA